MVQNTITLGHRPFLSYEIFFHVSISLSRSCQWCRLTNCLWSSWQIDENKFGRWTRVILDESHEKLVLFRKNNTKSPSMAMLNQPSLSAAPHKITNQSEVKFRGQVESLSYEDGLKLFHYIVNTSFYWLPTALVVRGMLVLLRNGKVKRIKFKNIHNGMFIMIISESISLSCFKIITSQVAVGLKRASGKIPW